MEKYLGYLERFNLDRKQKYKKLSKGMKIKAQLAFALSYGAKAFFCSMSLLQGLTSTSGRIF